MIVEPEPLYGIDELTEPRCLVVNDKNIGLFIL